ncbi:MAG: ABC transporter permease [Ruminococcaceae bacterium]|nr:ABC transporter permease [Oscillospiraceae bacterium]
MKMWTFARRCAKEILRDPMNLAFGLGFPVVLLLLLSAIQANVPVDLFRITELAPGISVFGLAFMSLFSATLIARDRESALLQRLYTTPLQPADFILGYLLPMVPMALAQTAVCYLVAIPLGLSAAAQIPLAILVNLPMAVFNISLGLLCGSILNVKQVGGICGALLTNLSAWLSGVWFDLDLVGGVFRDVAEVLPFVHAVELARCAIRGDHSNLTEHLGIVVLYAVLASVGAVALFLRQMKRR